MAVAYVPPLAETKSMECPHCGKTGLFTQHPVIDHFFLDRRSVTVERPYGVCYGDLGRANTDQCFFVDPGMLCIWRCPACGGLVLEKNGCVIWPIGSGLKPSDHMPENIRKPFIEAQSIATASPWAACTLLRICLERLVELLGGEGRNLYERIESLGLAADEKPIWDAIRRIGNDAAHEGLFPYADCVDLEVEKVVSNFVNLLVERHIAAPAKASKMLAVLEAAQAKSKS